MSQSTSAQAAKRALAQRNLIDFTRQTFPKYKVNWHHEVIAEHLEAVERLDIRKLIITTPPRRGKALHVGTPIATPDRGFVRIDDLEPGDKVFGSNGAPTTVLAKSDVHRDRPTFRVTTNDGDEVIADAAHEWVVQTCRKSDRWRTRETRSLIRASKTNRAWPVKMQSPLKTDATPLRIEPYVLGFWLGDGCSHHATITVGDQDHDFIRDQFDAAGYETTNRSTDHTFGVLGLQTELCIENLLDNKHVPSSYLFADVQARLALLQGLIDSDGHVDESGKIEFCSTSKSLAEAVQHLARSLGARASLNTGRATLDGVDHGPKYRVFFYLKNAARLPRKRSRTRNQTKRPHRYIRVEPSEPADTVCIQVDAEDSLFLAGRGLVPTHNSELVSRRLPAWLFGRQPDAKVILASHTQDLAESMSRDVQRIMTSRRYTDVFGARLGDGKEHKVTNKEFEVLGGGHFRAVGAGKRIAGIGAEYGIIDDYFGLRSDAESPTKRDTLWEWYQDDFLNRLNYPYAQIVMATRWHHDDLIGRLLNAGDADSWHVIHLPEILDTEAKHPDDPRDFGEPLWPGWFRNGPEDDATHEDLVARAKASFDERMAANAYGTEALLQGRPTPRKGGLFKRDHMSHYNGRPEQMASNCDEMLISVDAAFKRTNSSDFVAILVIGKRDNMYFVLDEHVERLDYPGTKSAIRRMYERWPNATTLIEDKANGSALISELGRELPRVVPFNPKNESKESRAQLAANAFEADQVRLPPPKHCPWIGEWIEDLVGFPGRPHDDRVDAFSQAVIRWSTSQSGLSSLMRVLGRR